MAAFGVDGETCFLISIGRKHLTTQVTMSVHLSRETSPRNAQHSAPETFKAKNSLSTVLLKDTEHNVGASVSVRTGGAPGITRVRVRDATPHPTVLRAAPPQRMTQPRCSRAEGRPRQGTGSNPCHLKG